MSQGVTVLTKAPSNTWLMTWRAVCTRHYSEVFARGHLTVHLHRQLRRQRRGGGAHGGASSYLVLYAILIYTLFRLSSSPEVLTWWAVNSVLGGYVTLISSKPKVCLLKDGDPVGLSASRSVGFQKCTVLIGRTGFDTIPSMPDPTLSFSQPHPPEPVLYTLLAWRVPCSSICGYSTDFSTS
jgi:hypothetical protein